MLSLLFLVFLLDDRRIRIREAQKHIDPTDPDPQHSKIFNLLSRVEVENLSLRTKKK